MVKVLGWRKLIKITAERKREKSIKKSAAQIRMGSGLGRKAGFSICLTAAGSDAVICISAHFSIKSLRSLMCQH